jgi:hypothetical protein
MSLGGFSLRSDNNILIAHVDAMKSISDQGRVAPIRQQMQYDNLLYEIAAGCHRGYWGNNFRDHFFTPPGMKRTFTKKLPDGLDNVALAYNTLGDGTPIEIPSVRGGRGLLWRSLVWTIHWRGRSPESRFRLRRRNRNRSTTARTGVLPLVLGELLCAPERTDFAAASRTSAAKIPRLPSGDADCAGRRAQEFTAALSGDRGDARGGGGEGGRGGRDTGPVLGGARPGGREVCARASSMAIPLSGCGRGTILW